MEARGFASPNKKTYLKEILDTPIEKIIRWFYVFLILLTLGSWLWQ